MAYSKLQKSALERARSNYAKMSAKEKRNMGSGTATKVEQSAGTFAERRKTEGEFGLNRGEFMRKKKK